MNGEIKELKDSVRNYLVRLSGNNVEDTEVKLYKDLQLIEKQIDIVICGCDPEAFAPPHFASAHCESGKRNHCSCDRCF